MNRAESRKHKDIKLNTRERADHAISVHDYPELDLDQNEYVLIDVNRTMWVPLGIRIIVVVSVIGLGLLAFLDKNRQFDISPDDWINLLCLLIAIVVAIIGRIAIWVYGRNRLIVTNQRIFDKIQMSLFSFRMQDIELEHIEDISYSKDGIIARIFDYGTIRFSTVGNEHTYQLTFVDDPERQIRVIKKVVHDVDEGQATRYKPPKN